MQIQYVPQVFAERQEHVVTVADIISLPAFKSIELAAECPGAGSRPAWNIGILDGTPENTDYKTFLPGEFIISNLAFTFDDVEVTDRSIAAMLERDVAALAVNKEHFSKVGPKTLEVIERKAVPLYVYDGEYLEIIAYQGLDLIRQDEAQSDKKRLVDELLRDRDSEQIRDIMFRLANATGSIVLCIAASPKNNDDLSLYALHGSITDVLTRLRQAFDDVETTHVCRYKDKLLGFVSYSKSNSATNAKDKRRESQKVLVKNLTSIIGMRLGISEECPLSDGDLSVREAFTCLDYAQAKKLNAVYWTNLHQDAFRAAAKASRLANRISDHNKKLLANYDAEFGTQLEETCRALSQSFGDIRRAAEKLCVHPNSVRYRTRRAKEVLGMTNASDAEFFFFLGLVFLENKDEAAV